MGLGDLNPHSLFVDNFGNIFITSLQYCSYLSEEYQANYLSLISPEIMMKQRYKSIYLT